VVAILVLVLGILRGTVFGPINSLEDLFGTAYGWTWLVSLVATLGLVFTGARYVGPMFGGLKDADDYPAAVARLRRVSRIDLGIFFVVFTCMIRMRFGL
jgi:putative copper export protein